MDIEFNSVILNNVPKPVPPSSAVANVSTVQLSYLTTVARTRTWADAARQLQVTPSALSQGIAELERRLGVELFGWSGRRRVQLPHTSEVVAYAERVLAETGDLTRWLDRVRGGGIGQLRVGMIDAAAVFHFRGRLSDFRHARPELDMHVSVAPTGELLEALGRGDIDVAICVDPAGEGPFDSQPLLREALAVYRPAGRKGARTSSMPSTPAERWGPWVLFPQSSRTRQAIDRELRALGAPLDIEMESHQPEVLAEMVRIGMGWSVLPVAQAEGGQDPLTRAMKEPLLERLISAVTRRATPLHPAAAELIAHLLPIPDARRRRASAVGRGGGSR